MNGYKVINFGRPIAKGDIQEAIRCMPSPPVLISLSRFNNEKFSNEIPEGVKVEIRGGVLLTEFYFTDQENITPENRWQGIKEDIPVSEPVIQDHLTEQDYKDLQMPIQQAMQTRGRPRKSGQLSRTTFWRRRIEMKKTEAKLL